MAFIPCSTLFQGWGAVLWEWLEGLPKSQGVTPLKILKEWNK